jgi:hypothetical protein
MMTQIEQMMEDHIGGINKLNRLQAIKALYDFESETVNCLIVDDEVIKNWYIDGYPSIEKIGEDRVERGY